MLVRATMQTVGVHRMQFITFTTVPQAYSATRPNSMDAQDKFTGGSSICNWPRESQWHNAGIAGPIDVCKPGLHYGLPALWLQRYGVVVEECWIAGNPISHYQRVGELGHAWALHVPAIERRKCVYICLQQLTGFFSQSDRSRSISSGIRPFLLSTSKRFAPRSKTLDEFSPTMHSMTFWPKHATKLDGLLRPLICATFYEYGMGLNDWNHLRGHWSLKVIDIGVIRYATYRYHNLILAFHYINYNLYMSLCAIFEILII